MAIGLSRQAGQLLLTLVISSAASVLLYAVGALFNNGVQFYYLIWNLFLAWLPLVFAYGLRLTLRKKLWSSWPALGLTFLWLLFLPNSFYLVSDFIHLYDALDTNLLFNTAMFGSFAFSGLALGVTSVILVHQQLLKRLIGLYSWTIIGLALLLSSYAVYLGRYVRLNSWDVFTNFGTVLFNFSDQVLSPSKYFSIIGTSLGFFVFIASVYLVIWRLFKLSSAKL